MQFSTMIRKAKDVLHQVLVREAIGAIAIITIVLLTPFALEAVYANEQNGGETMCSICWQNPCHPSCPNADEHESGYVCKYCDESIADGEDCYVIDGDHFHTECLEENAFEIMKEYVDVTEEVAEKGGEYYDREYDEFDD